MRACMQVLYFIPELRTALFRHAPEPQSEWCLACELAFLFTMLRKAQGTHSPVQVRTRPGQAQAGGERGMHACMHASPHEPQR